MAILRLTDWPRRTSNPVSEFRGDFVCAANVVSGFATYRAGGAGVAIVRGALLIAASL